MEGAHKFAGGKRMPEVTPQEFSTVLGPDASFKGELTFEKGVRIHGRFEGKIQTAGRLHVAREAKLQADVDAGSIVVDGEIRGNIHANERVELKQSARYEGDLIASKLVVDEGAVFSGHVTVGPDVGKNNKPSVSVSVNRHLGGAAAPAQPARQG
jgi:cytoskeletal protein CcmA (bactofilin family)